MSIVGTRPPLVSETNLYEPHHKVRLQPGAGAGCWLHQEQTYHRRHDVVRQVQL